MLQDEVGFNAKHHCFHTLVDLTCKQNLLSFIQFTKFVICASAATFIISYKTDLGKIE